MVDAFQLPMGNGVMLIMSVHGEFNDGLFFIFVFVCVFCVCSCISQSISTNAGHFPEYLPSFLLYQAQSECFLLFTCVLFLMYQTPLPFHPCTLPIQRASQAGWHYSILNDMLTVRSWAQDRVWLDNPPAPQSAAPTTGPLIGSQRSTPMAATAAVSNPINGVGMSLGPEIQSAGLVLQQQQQQFHGALPNDPTILSALMNALGLVSFGCGGSKLEDIGSRYKA